MGVEKEKKEECNMSCISRNWINIIKPTDYRVIKSDRTKATFIIEPLEKGFGITLASCLRRIILSSIYGNSIYAIKIDGVSHEYCSIKGIKEDISEIILNLKDVFVKGNLGFSNKELFIKVYGKKIITSRDIEVPNKFEITDKNIFLFTVTSNIYLKMILMVKSDRGYISANNHYMTNVYGNYIPLDVNFSPIKKCIFNVYNSDVDTKKQYDKIVLSVKTNGTIDPTSIVPLASKILYEQIKILVQYIKLSFFDNGVGTNLVLDKNYANSINVFNANINSKDFVRYIYIQYEITQLENTYKDSLKLYYRDEIFLNRLKNKYITLDLFFYDKIFYLYSNDFITYISKNFSTI